MKGHYVTRDNNFLLHVWYLHGASRVSTQVARVDLDNESSKWRLLEKERLLVQNSNRSII